MAGHDDVTHYGGRRYEATQPAAWRDLTCGWCQREVSAAVVSEEKNGSSQGIWWLRCTSCQRPSTLAQVAYDNWIQHPNPLPPNLTVSGLPPTAHKAFDDAKRSYGVRGYTSTVLMCRKLLMHAACDKAGGKAGNSFVQYLNDLATAGYITPAMKSWTDRIRELGNIGTHELPEIDESTAKDALTFTTQLLRLVYEMEHLNTQNEPEYQVGDES